MPVLLSLWRLTPWGLRSTSRSAATRGTLATFAATILFGALHSLFCLPATKRGAQKLLGERYGRGFYRLFFNLQSLATTGALVLFTLTRPARVLYAAPQWARPLHWLVQASALVIAVWSVKELRPSRFSGVEGASEALRGEGEPDIPEAQTPDEMPYERGPYAWSRHPVEWAPLALLWGTPLLKTNWLGFNLATTLYMLVGVFAEEKRLEAKGGEAYRTYQKRVNLFFGRRKDA